MRLPFSSSSATVHAANAPPSSSASSDCEFVLIEGSTKLSLEVAASHKAARWTPPKGEYTPLPPPHGDIRSVPWTPVPAKPILFLNANVVDVAANKVLERRSVLLKDGFVESLSPTVAEDALLAGSDVRIIDLDGLWLCPGLVDCHVHVNFADGFGYGGGPYVVPELRATYTLKRMLSRGFTTVRDVGGATIAQAQAIEQWLTPGPRLFQAGGAILSQTGGHGDGRGQHEQAQGGCCGEPSNIVDGVPACLKATRDLLRRGADHIKICTSGGVSSPTDGIETIQFTAEEIRAISTVARNMGDRDVTAHCYEPTGIRLAIENGVKGIEHGNLIDRPTAELMAKLGCILTPTLMISTSKSREPWNSSLPSYMRVKNSIVMQRGRESLKIADDAGVMICFGTDLTAGQMYLQSEEFTVRASILPSHKVLAHATTNAAIALKDPRIGIISPGAYADVIVLSANPLADVRVLDGGKGVDGIWGVVKGGRLVLARAEVADKFSCYGGVDTVLDVGE